jgi:hypothetical protein
MDLKKFVEQDGCHHLLRPGDDCVSGESVAFCKEIEQTARQVRRYSCGRSFALLVFVCLMIQVHRACRSSLRVSKNAYNSLYFFNKLPRDASNQSILLRITVDQLV